MSNEMKLASVGDFYDDDKMFVIAMAEPPRVGAMLFSSILEYWKYPPRTPANALYNLGIIKFGKVAGMTDPFKWFIMSFPITDKPFAEEAAKKSFVVLQHTFPIIVENIAVASVGKDSLDVLTKQGADVQVFPMMGSNIYTLENESGFHEKITGSENYARFLHIERQLCSKIMQGDDKKATDEELAKFADLMKSI